MGKASSEIIKLCSSSGSGHFYTIVKNRRSKLKKIQLKKFDPKVRKHVVYIEGKL